jgi:hypothetical protein
LKTNAQVTDFYKALNAAQNKYSETNNEMFLWLLYDELIELSKSVLYKQARYPIDDIEGAAADIAVLLIDKMKKHYVEYVGSLAKKYALRYTTRLNAVSLEGMWES